jgi:hypothetical protein
VKKYPVRNLTRNHLWNRKSSFSKGIVSNLFTCNNEKGRRR